MLAPASPFVCLFDLRICATVCAKKEKRKLPMSTRFYSVCVCWCMYLRSKYKIKNLVLLSWPCVFDVRVCLLYPAKHVIGSHDDLGDDGVGLDWRTFLHHGTNKKSTPPNFSLCLGPRALPSVDRWFSRQPTCSTLPLWITMVVERESLFFYFYIN